MLQVVLFIYFYTLCTYTRYILNIYLAITPRRSESLLHLVCVINFRFV